MSPRSPGAGNTSGPPPGGGPDDRSRATQRLGMWWLLPIGFAAGLLVLLQGSIRQGGYVIAGTLALGALARLLLPQDALGGLVVRSRAWDVIVLLGLALGLAVVSATLVLPPQPVTPGG